MDVILDGAPFVTHLDYGEGTGDISIPPGSHTLQVEIETPGSPPTVIGPTALNATANMDYVVAIQGCVEGLPQAQQAPNRVTGCLGTPPAALSLMITSHQLAVVPAESTRVQIINSYISAVNVYVSATAALSSATLIGTVPPEGSVCPMQVSPGILSLVNLESQLSVRLAQQPIAAGTDLILSALAPVRLIQLVDPPFSGPCCAIAASSVDASEVNTTTASGYVAIRGNNVSPDSTALSLLVDANLPLTPTYQEVVPALAAAEPGVYRADFAIVLAINPSQVLARKTVDLRSSLYKAYSLWAFGPLAHLSLLVTQDDFRRYATQARWRFN